MTLTSSPLRPIRSERMPSAIIARPAFVAAYVVIDDGMPRIADIEEMTTRWPALRS